jgi:hypothetical protein
MEEGEWRLLCIMQVMLFSVDLLSAKAGCDVRREEGSIKALWHKQTTTIARRPVFTSREASPRI